MLGIVFWNARHHSSDAEQYEAALKEFHSALSADKPKGFRFSTSFRAEAVPWFKPECEIFEDWYVIKNFAAMDMLDQFVIRKSKMEAHRYLMKNTAMASGGIFYLSKGTARVDRLAEAYWVSTPRGGKSEGLIEHVNSQGHTTSLSYWTRAMALGPAENCLLTNTAVDIPKENRPIHFPRELFWSPSTMKN